MTKVPADSVVSRRGFIVRGVTGAAALGGTSALLAACGSSSGGGGKGGGKEIRIGYSAPFSENSTSADIQRRVQAYGESLGYTMLIDHTTGGNVQNQLSTLNSWITQGVGAMSVLAPDPTALRPVMEKAEAKGIAYTSVIFSVPGTNGGALFDPADSGRQIGEAAVKWINENDPTAEVLVHTFKLNPPIAARWEIPTQMIKEQTRATIVASQDANTQEDGFTVTQTALKAHPGISVVIGQSDDSALGAARAFRLAGKDPAKSWISGYDGTPEALNAISEGGAFKATAAVDHEVMAKAIVDLSAQLIKDGLPRDGHQVNKMVGTILVEHGDPRLPALLKANGG